MIDGEKVAPPSGDGGSGRKRPNSPLDRVLRALNHPVRRRILRSLVDGTGSASTLAKELRLDLGVTSYHLNQVLAKECGIVELIESVPRRGAIEKFYRLKFQALTEGDLGQRGDSESGSRAMSLEECFIVAVSAMDADAFATLEGSAWEWFLAQVDSEGWREIREASADFDRRAQAAVHESQARAGGSEVHDVVVGVAAFPAVSPPLPSS